MTSEGDDRPRVIVSVVATADGRVTLSPAERLLDDDTHRRWRTAWPPDTGEVLGWRDASIAEHRPTVVLEGSGTFVAPEAGPAELPATTAETAELHADFLPRRTPRWFAVVDGRGRVPWTHTGDAETSLLVLTCRDTPLPYLADLRRREIPYLVAGSGRVDLAGALGRLRTRLGAGCVLSEAGGGLNGALLRAGLVDELHIVTVPALVGGLGTPSVADGPPLPPGALPVRLRTDGVRVGARGTVWARYTVVR